MRFKKKANIIYNIRNFIDIQRLNAENVTNRVFKLYHTFLNVERSCSTFVEPNFHYTLVTFYPPLKLHVSKYSKLITFPRIYPALKLYD